MRNFDINIKDNNIVIALLDGAMLVERAAVTRHEVAVNQDSSVSYYKMKLAESKVIYTSLDYTWHRNQYNSVKRYAGTDPVSVAELAVDKAKMVAVKAKYVVDALAAKAAEEEWMK